MSSADALFAALDARDPGAVAALLDADPALVTARHADGWTPLHLACFYGLAAVVEGLLARGGDVAARSDNAMRNTPLHAALAGAREAAVVDHLLAHGADAAAPAAGGVTPLHLAASRGEVALIDRLLAHGAVPTAMDDGQRPADLAEARGHPGAAAHLRRAAGD